MSNKVEEPKEPPFRCGLCGAAAPNAEDIDPALRDKLLAAVERSTEGELPLRCGLCGACSE